MTQKALWLSLVVIVTVGLLAILPSPNFSAKGTAGSQKQTTFTRVMNSGTLRCGYAVWHPVLYKDMQTGEIKGIAHDIIETAAHNLGLRVQWTEEAGWDSIVEGLSTGRYDAICTTIGPLASRARAIDFSTPLFYTPVYMIGRADETRFHTFEDFNDPAYTVSALDGEGFSILISKKFPKVAIRSLPQMTAWASIFQDIVAGKADAAGVDYATFESYNKKNPGKIKILIDKPIQVFSVAFGVPQGEIVFKHMLDVALDDLLLDGTVDRVLRKYTPSPLTFLRRAEPYVLPDSSIKVSAP
ncbi:MAG: transporter substrate-binding domain-containing protein [Alphaproteobacteria bacterium]|nr:transporter substrate-binding domain-containing protein [Alphaproteobacteria bacterium]